MKCPNCNFDVTHPTKFCPECGAKLPEELNEATPQSAAEQAPAACEKPKKSKKKLVVMIAIPVACVAVLLGAFFILRAINPGCMFGHDSTREEKIKEATCTDLPRYRYVCVKCGETDREQSWGTFLEHDYGKIQCGVVSTCKNCGEKKTFEHYEEDGKCRHCGQARFTINFPALPQVVHCYDSRGNIMQSITVTDIECVEQYGYSSVHFTVKRTYHENGANQSASGKLGWKLYDADGVIIEGGTAYTDGGIKMGETGKGKFNVRNLEDWKEYRLEILHLS